MHILIVDDDATRQTELTYAFMVLGFQTTATASHAVAESCIRRDWVDLLLMPERVSQRLTHSLALLAEWRNPMVATMLLSPRSGEDSEELFDLIPSLYCLLAPETATNRVTAFALASITGGTRRLPPLVLNSTHQIYEKNEADPIFATMRSALAETTEFRLTA